MAWLLLGAFRQIYTENQELKAEQMIQKPCSPDRKGAIRKPWLRRVFLLKGLTPLKGSQPLHPRTTENWPDPTHQRL